MTIDHVMPCVATWLGKLPHQGLSGPLPTMLGLSAELPVRHPVS